MADSELEEIRARRLAEMQQQYGQQDPNARKEQEEQLKRQDDMINAILNQALDQNARARLNSIALVKPDKAKMIERMLVQMTQTGQIPGKIGEDQLRGLLQRVNEQTQRKTTIKFNRRRALDSDDDDY